MDLKNYVVKDRDYKKIALVLLGLGVFGLFFSVVLFPQIGLHVFKWVSFYTSIFPTLDLCNQTIPIFDTGKKKIIEAQHSTIVFTYSNFD